MFGLLVALVLGLLIGGPVAAVVALMRTSRLREQVGVLQGAVSVLQDEARTRRSLRDAFRERPRHAEEPEATPPASSRQAILVPPPLPQPDEPAPVPAPERRDTGWDPEPPPPAPTPGLRALEERLGTRFFVWIGGIALALAGAFLVKYSIDQGWLAPAVRCALGGALGLALLGIGEVVRVRAARIAQSVSAAGVAVLYASLFAAVALYALIDRATGFTLLAGLTAGAIALALRQGPFVGLLGLAGGFLTPAILRSDAPSALMLFGYLLAIQLGSQVLRRRRGWSWPSAVAVAGGLLWAALWLGEMPRSWSEDVWLALFLIATCAAASWAQRATPVPAPFEDWTAADWQVPATHAVALLLLAALVGTAGFGFEGWMFFGLLAVGQIVLARFRPEHEPLAAVAAGLAALLLILWPLPSPDETSRFILVLVALAALFAGGGFIGMWGARRPDRWALLSALATAGGFLIAYGRLRGMDGFPSWGLVSLAVAALHVGAAERVARYRGAGSGYEQALGVHTLAAAGFVAFAIPLELQHGWIAVGWSLLLPAAAWIESRLRIAWLRHVAWVAAALVLVRLLPGPWILAFPTGTTPVFNWLLYGYGVPLLALTAAARIFRRQADDALVCLLEAGAVAIGVLLVTLELHHFFQGSLRFTRGLGLVETASFVTAWLILAVGLTHAAARSARPMLRWSARVVAVGSAAALLGGPLLATNPLFWPEPVGKLPILNWLLLAYALPALLLAALGRLLESTEDRRFAVWLSWLAASLGLLFVSLEIRQVFQGSLLVFADIRIGELSCLVIAWLLIALALFRLSGGRSLYLQMARVLLTLAVAALVLGSLLLVNPLLTAQEVGTWPLVNWLVPAYAVPALLLAMAVRHLQDPQQPWQVQAPAVLALVLGFVFVTLELRQWFHGSRLDLGGIGTAETYAYSVGWILYGLALLAAGILRGGAALRYASLAVVVLAVGKVFLVDAAALTGLYRVASFLGLGISLLAIGYAYQRFVFRRADGAPAPLTPPPTRS